MTATLRIIRSDGTVLISGLDAGNVSGSIQDVLPSTGTFTYTLEAEGPDGDTRVLGYLAATVLNR